MSKPALISIVGSVLPRLPFGFLVPFIGLTGPWILYLHKKVSVGLRGYFDWPYLFLSAVDEVAYVLLMVLLFAIGLFLAYNFSVWFNQKLVGRWRKSHPRARIQPYAPAQQPTASELFGDVNKIGIVLAGGGAKGAFQAGAMEAIYGFLAQNNALSKVEVIAGTSIGSWNALFWLANLLDTDKPDGQTELKKWWSSIQLKSLVTPSWYAPACRNAFFETTPWEAQFDEIFKQPAVRDQIYNSPIKFYFTHSNVQSGQLECTTNSQNEDLPVPRANLTILKRTNPEQFVDGIKRGVFASMDLPPLFPYVKMGNDYCEDGGVIDNLPIMFAAADGCDVVFILPLNSDFYADLNRRSIITRFVRVMDVRQGALERNGFKMVYLFNELAALRDHHQKTAPAPATAAPKQTIASAKTWLDRALARRHKPIRVIAVCPDRSFVRSTIDTHEFWKSEKAGLAFDKMYAGTSELLRQKFREFLDTERIQVALIDQSGKPKIDQNF
jgi:NTE family protein